MRAYVHDTENKKKREPFHGSKLKLTIGMIVKNEEKTLEKCLKSLMPLLNAVSSELIITDTGSTDHTVEIAEKYTNHIIHFEWCDDFSAARNTGLEEACGEWFMTIDGDEWFEDVTEIINFFNSGECDSYCSACYKIRNYHDQDGKTYTESHVVRIYKGYEGMHFTNIVHETIGGFNSFKFFDAYVHHFGYVYNNQEDLMNKFQRNTKLLKKALKENPNNLRSLFELAKEYFVVGDIEKSIEYNRKGLEIEKDHPNRINKISFQHNLLRGYFRSEANQKVLDTLEEFLAEEKCEEIDYLDYYFWSEAAAFKLGQYRNAVRLGQKYLEVYKKYQEHKLNMKRLLYTTFSCIGPEYKEEVIRKIGQSYLLQHDDEQAVACLKRLDLSIPYSIQRGLYALGFEVAVHGGKWNIISDFYNNILSLKDKERKYEFIDCIEAYAIKNPILRSEIFYALSKSESRDDYVTLCRLRCAEDSGEMRTVLECIDWFFQNEIDCNECFSDVLYFAMKEKINILPFILKINMDEMQYYSTAIEKYHSDFISVIPEYFEAYSFENLKGLYWTICLKEKVILKERDMNEEKLLCLFEKYARQTALYVSSVYRDEILTSNAISILPSVCRFGYYMGAAFSAQTVPDYAAYLENLRSALSSYPVMKKPISLLLERFQREREKEDNKTTELVNLSLQVKKQIETMLACGKLHEASIATVQLAALLPNDEDVKRFQKMTSTESIV